MLTLDKNEGKILFIRTIANETVAIDLSKVRRITLNELGRSLSPTFKSGKSLGFKDFPKVENP